MVLGVLGVALVSSVALFFASDRLRGGARGVVLGSMGSTWGIVTALSVRLVFAGVSGPRGEVAPLHYRELVMRQQPTTGLPDALWGRLAATELYARPRSAHDIVVAGADQVRGLVLAERAVVDGVRAWRSARRVVWAGQAKGSAEVDHCAGAVEPFGVAGRLLFVLGCQATGTPQTRWTHRIAEVPAAHRALASRQPDPEADALVPPRWVGLWSSTKGRCGRPAEASSYVVLSASSLVGHVGWTDIAVHQLRGRREGGAFVFSGVRARSGGSGRCRGRIARPAARGTLSVRLRCEGFLDSVDTQAFHLCARLSQWPPRPGGSA